MLKQRFDWVLLSKVSNLNKHLLMDHNLIPLQLILCHKDSFLSSHTWTATQFRHLLVHVTDNTPQTSYHSSQLHILYMYMYL